MIHFGNCLFFIAHYITPPPLFSLMYFSICLFVNLNVRFRVSNLLSFIDIKTIAVKLKHILSMLKMRQVKLSTSYSSLGISDQYKHTRITKKHVQNIIHELITNKNIVRIYDFLYPRIYSFLSLGIIFFL